MEIRYHGHSCFEISGYGGRVLIDPFLTGNPKADIKAEDIQQLDGILVSHGHADHLGDAIEISKRTGAPIIGVYEMALFCERCGARAHAMHIGGKHEFTFGTVRLTQALHGSFFEVPGSENNFEYAGLACGFLLQMEGKWLYHAGDTGLFGDMELIGRRHPLELAMLPIGDNFVMGQEEAAYAATLLRAKRVIPMHYNTFSNIKQDPNEFNEMLRRKFPESQGIALKPGEILRID
ncbi:metal-dependent hydrolase [Desulfitobacterium sp.]|uniref:metal-dependent hydrolase n=1 Tax=Desulfitobacterium sp. TaxID=49981 RepID=UPI002B218188|nr:metal-dependent hydrolase [Desulfitobacterium sp.]MEA4901360.1 metal-dependent hydrolase [Desulfitobacterium sp.]